MPVKSEKQRRFMYASLAGKTDVSPSVAKKFVGSDAHKADGGAVKESEMKSKKMMFGAANKAQEKRHVAAMEKAGVPKGIVREEKKEAGMKMNGMTKKYAMGGLADALNNIGSGMPPSRLSPADRERIAATTMAANARREAMKGASSRMGTAVSPDQSPTSRGVGGGMNVRGFGGQGALSPEQVAALGQAIAPRPAPRPGSGDTPPAPTPPRPTMPPARPGPTPPSTMPIRPPGMKKGGAAKGYAKGGSTRADGCATKGRTKTKMVKMAGGGKC